MTTLIILALACTSVGVLTGAAVMARLSSGAYHKGYEDAEQNNALRVDQHIDEALRAAAGPFDPSHQIWIGQDERAHRD